MGNLPSHSEPPGTYGYFKKTPILVVMVALQGVTAVISLVIFFMSFSFNTGTMADFADRICAGDATSKPSVECQEALKAFFGSLASLSLAGSIPSILVNGGLGIWSSFKLNKLGLGFYIGLSIVTMIVLWVTGGLASIYAAILGTYCLLASYCTPCQNEIDCALMRLAATNTSQCFVEAASYQTLCVDLTGRISTVIGVFVVAGLLTFIVSIMTCTIIGKVGRSNTQHVIVHHMGRDPSFSALDDRNVYANSAPSGYVPGQAPMYAQQHAQQSQYGVPLDDYNNRRV